MTDQNKIYYDFGFEKFGPFLFGFMQWLRNEIKENQYEKILFFSRDGYMMKRANDILQTTKTLPGSFEYVYFSRNSLRHALLWTTKGYKDSLKYMTRTRYMPFSEIAAYYGITREECRAKQIKISWTEDILYEGLQTNRKVSRFFEAFQKEIKEKSHRQYELLIDYLKQLGIEGKKAAVVDIGWHGTMQAYLEEVLQKAEMEAEIAGYYVGTCQSAKVSGTMKGYIYSKKEDPNRKKLLAFFGVAEKFFQSQEGSAKDYKKQGSNIVPTQEEYEYKDDPETVKKLMALQEGALSYVRSKGNAPTGLEMLPLIQFGTNPTLQEAKMFSFLYNTDGVKAYFLPQKPIFQYKAKEFIHALSNSCWKVGFMKFAFKLPFPYYLIYKMLRT